MPHVGPKLRPLDGVLIDPGQAAPPRQDLLRPVHEHHKHELLVLRRVSLGVSPPHVILRGESLARLLRCVATQRNYSFFFRLFLPEVPDFSSSFITFLDTLRAETKAHPMDQIS